MFPEAETYLVGDGVYIVGDSPFASDDLGQGLPLTQPPMECHANFDGPNRQVILWAHGYVKILTDPTYPRIHPSRISASFEVAKLAVVDHVKDLFNRRAPLNQLAILPGGGGGKNIEELLYLSPKGPPDQNWGDADAVNECCYGKAEVYELLRLIIASYRTEVNG
jgi:hypothetical protein